MATVKNNNENIKHRKQTNNIKLDKSINKYSHARFTKREKEILFSLFHKYEAIIDYKQRKKLNRERLSITTVRDCWEKIAKIYNCNPNITTKREIKQIQKFWLNSRLRKTFPSEITLNKKLPPSPSVTISIPRKYEDSTSIKCESEEIIIPVPTEIHHHHEKNYQVEENENDYQEHNIISSNQIEENNSEQELPNCIEQISAEKLTLSDLLQFKGSIAANSKATNTISNNSEDYHQTEINEISADDIHNNIKSGYSQTNINSAFENDFLNDKLNCYKLKEAEIKFEEDQIRLEKHKIELEKLKEELNHMKEMHRLEIEEKKMRLSILSIEVKNVSKKKPN